MAKACRQNLFWIILILIGGISAYSNTFAVPFLFDDLHSIRWNQTIRHLWPLWEPLSPPHGGLTVSGRPLVNLSLAFNHALGGWHVGGYHVWNLAVHLLAGLTLFGVVRRTLEAEELATPLAGVTALLWTLHPLQTEAVTYIGQRVESMAGLFYLLTLYAFIRSLKNEAWKTVSVLACACGMGCKETMASAPLLVLFYDRAFVTGSFRAAIERRIGYYIALALTWVILGKEVAWEQMRSGTAGAGEITAYNYLVTQGFAIAHYVRLAFWPYPQIFDYGTATVGWGRAWPGFVMVACVGAGTAWAMVRRPRVGFLGLWFFAILAPSSSFVPVATQTMAEHRIYLSLAALIAGVVLLLYRGIGINRVIALGLLAALGLGLATFRRNADYASAESIWRDTTWKLPTNGRAWCDWGEALREEGRNDAALKTEQIGLAVDPKNPFLWCNVGLIYYLQGDQEQAIIHFRRSLELLPQDAVTHSNLGDALYKTGRIEEARVEYVAALRLRPDCVPAWNNLGTYYRNMGNKEEARKAYKKALEFDPENRLAHRALESLDAAP